MVKHTCRAELRRLNDSCGLRVTVLSRAHDSQCRTATFRSVCPTVVLLNCMKRFEEGKDLIGKCLVTTPGKDGIRNVVVPMFSGELGGRVELVFQAVWNSSPVFIVFSSESLNWKRLSISCGRKRSVAHTTSVVVSAG